VNTPLLMMLGVLAMGMLLVVFPVVADIVARYRGRKLVRCPETQELVEVQLNTRRALWTATFGEAMPRVNSCSRWPKKKGCSEECVKENWLIP
jgi:hypothetical protein